MESAGTKRPIPAGVRIAILYMPSRTSLAPSVLDINRSYDFLSDFQAHFNRLAWNAVASTKPNTDKFNGLVAFSEAESRNVRSVFDRFLRIRWYMDIHSAAGLICYSWGDDDNGTDPD